MIAVDTSVVVAAFASWHELHEPARSALDEGAVLPAQAALESYSVLTSLPPPHRAPAHLVREFLSARFPDPYLTVGPERIRELIAELAERGIVGGSAYDALIAAVARGAAATLLTCDRRAEGTYARIGAAVRFLG